MTRIPDNHREDWNSHLRGAWVAVWLKGGSKLSTREISRLTGISRQGVEQMMTILAWGMPIRHEAGKWQWIGDD